MSKAFQLELFKQQQFPKDKIKKREYRPSFFAFLKNHEKIIIIIISFFITSLVSFSFGVERGKGLRLAQPTSRVEVEQTVEQAVQKKQPVEIKIEAEKVVPKYTIQVASFKTKTYANKEAERLKKNGHEALIIPGERYVIVCVGNFSKKQEADVTLSQLKKTYHDCFIKKL